jgi:hypothetical protein
MKARIMEAAGGSGGATLRFALILREPWAIEVRFGKDVGRQKEQRVASPLPRLSTVVREGRRMESKTPTDPALPHRNRSAQASLVIALVFLTQCVAFVAIIATGMSSWGVRLAATNPDHPFVNLAGLVVELSILFLLLDLIVGTLAILLGIRGLVVARRQPGNLGRDRSIAGLVLAALVLLLPFLTVLLWASAFRQ